MNAPPPIPPNRPQQLIEDAMQTYLIAVSDALSRAGNIEHIITLATNIALPNGNAFTLTGEIKTKKPEPVERPSGLVGLDGNPFVIDPNRKPS